MFSSFEFGLTTGVHSSCSRLVFVLLCFHPAQERSALAWPRYQTDERTAALVYTAISAGLLNPPQRCPASSSFSSRGIHVLRYRPCVTRQSAARIQRAPLLHQRIDNAHVTSPGFGFSASRPSVLAQTLSEPRTTTQLSALRAARTSTPATATAMFFDFGNKKKPSSNARPVAGGTVKGGKKVRKGKITLFTTLYFHYIVFCSIFQLLYISLIQHR